MDLKIKSHFHVALFGHLMTSDFVVLLPEPSILYLPQRNTWTIKLQMFIMAQLISLIVRMVIIYILKLN